MTSGIEMVPFPRASADLRRLKVTSEDVARMTKPQREQRVRELVGLSHWIADRAVERYFQKHTLAATVILYSGGNDSTTLAHMFRARADFALHANTGIGVEQTRQFVRDTCADWGLALLEKHPPAGGTYRDLVIDQGFPGPAQHFKMYQRLKERCIEQARSDIVKRPFRERVLFLAGRRRSESARRSAITTWDRKGSMVFASPLTLWTKPDLNTYRLMCGDVPRNSVADLLHMSGECLCGSYAQKEELDMVGMWYPEVRNRIEALEAEIADREDIRPERRLWGWGAYRQDLDKLLASGRLKSGLMCHSCDSRVTGGEVVIAA